MFSLDCVDGFNVGVAHVTAVQFVGRPVEAAAPRVPEADGTDLGTTCSSLRFPLGRAQKYRQVWLIYCRSTWKQPFLLDWNGYSGCVNNS